VSWLRLLQLGLVAAVVAFIAVRSHPGEVWDVLRDVDLTRSLAATMLNIPVLLLTPLRSSLVFRRLGHRVPVDVLISTTILGFVAGGLTPAASGELLRAQALRARAGVPFEQGVVAVVYERVLALYYLALSACVVFALGRVDAGQAVAVCAGATALWLAPWLAAVAAWRFVPDGERIRGGGLLARGLRGALSMSQRLRLLLEDLRLLLLWSSISLAMFMLIAAQYWLLARAVGGDIGIGDAWVALGVSTFAGVAALIPLGLGVLDGSLAATLDRLGTTLEQGAVVAVLVRAVITLPLLLAAAACFLYLQRATERTLETPAVPVE
jgi:uncharacterized membrane protein YbhN (UPF0104 family)